MSNGTGQVWCAGSRLPTGGCAIVFGGSGGIGAATAGLLGQRGCDVLLAYRSRSTQAEELAGSIRALGRKATALSCDVTDLESTAAVIDAALAQYDRIHTVVSATGLHFRTGPLAEFTAAEFTGVVTADVLGFFNIAISTVRALRSGGGGSITAVIASAVERTVPTDAMSAAPKAAVVSGLVTLRGRSASTTRAHSLDIRLRARC